MKKHTFLLRFYEAEILARCSLLVTFCSLLVTFCSLFFLPNYCEIKLPLTAKKKWFDYNETPPQIFYL